MLNNFFTNENEIILKLLKSIGIKATQQKPSIDDCHIFSGVKNRIMELEAIEEKARFEREMLSRFLDYFLKVFRELSKAPEAETPKKETETSKEPEPPKSPEKIDSEPLPGPLTPRCKILEEGIKEAIKAFKKAPPSKRYKEAWRVNELLELSLGPSPNMPETGYIVRMEAAISEALKYLQTSKFAVHCKSLAEERKILEETMDKRIQA
jgi:hypothetical protein